MKPITVGGFDDKVIRIGHVLRIPNDGLVRVPHVAAENYFLGSSLFDKNATTDYDTMFYDASYLISTKDGQIRYLEDLEIDSFLSSVLSYFSALEAQQ